MNNKYQQVGNFILRIALGSIFLAHGWQKINGFDGVAGFFATLGLPPFLPYVITALETGAGICLLLGFLTRAAAAGIAANMVGAIVTVKLSAGFLGGYEYEVLILAAAVMLVLSGSQWYALDSLLRAEREK